MFANMLLESQKEQPQQYVYLLALLRQKSPAEGGTPLSGNEILQNLDLVNSNTTAQNRIETGVF